MWYKVISQLYFYVTYISLKHLIFKTIFYKGWSIYFWRGRYFVTSLFTYYVNFLNILFSFFLKKKESLKTERIYSISVKIFLLIEVSCGCLSFLVFLELETPPPSKLMKLSSSERQSFRDYVFIKHLHLKKPQRTTTWLHSSETDTKWVCRYLVFYMLHIF